jgi:radical SAM superfamily enzyme YgiQ (UPF0313 family)
MRVLFPLNPYNQQRQFQKKVWVYPALMAMYATYLRDKGNDVVWGWNMDSDGDRLVKNELDIDVPFEDLPAPDRVLTDAKNKRWQEYGNYKFHPATHMMSSNLCYYGKCEFCFDHKKIVSGQARGVRTVPNVISEIKGLIRDGYKEVFDDSGTLPTGRWRSDFIKRLSKFNRRIRFGCNLRLEDSDFVGMRNAGFRMVLIGIESGNQETLDKINKGTKADQIIPVLRNMSKAGLEPHTAWMTGYPWETEEDEQRTIDLCHYLLKKGYSKTAQVSVYSKPRTKPDPKSPGNNYLPRFYEVYKNPEYLINKVKDIRCWEDVAYLIRGAMKHNREFSCSTK